jgi:hypothetical protein
MTTPPRLSCGRVSFASIQLASLLIAAGCLLVLPGTSLGQRAPVLPVDEAPRDPEFFVFRARLQAAVAAHDTAEVMRVVSPGILTSLGGDGVRDEFRQYWSIAGARAR